MNSPPLNYTVAGTRTFPKGNHLRKQLLDNLLSYISYYTENSYQCQVFS